MLLHAWPAVGSQFGSVLYLSQPQHVVAVVVDVDDVSLVHVGGDMVAALDGLFQVPWPRVLRQCIWQGVLLPEPDMVQHVGDAVFGVNLHVLLQNAYPLKVYLAACICPALCTGSWLLHVQDD